MKSRLAVILGLNPWLTDSVNHPALRKAAGLTEDQMGKIVDYPSERESLHPMAGMKNIETIDGTEARFKLSEKAKRRRELAKKAALPAKITPKLHKNGTAPVSRGTKP